MLYPRLLACSLLLHCIWCCITTFFWRINANTKQDKDPLVKTWIHSAISHQKLHRVPFNQSAYVSWNLTTCRTPTPFSGVKILVLHTHHKSSTSYTKTRELNPGTIALLLRAHLTKHIGHTQVVAYKRNFQGMGLYCGRLVNAVGMLGIYCGHPLNLVRPCPKACNTEREKCDCFLLPI